MCSSRKSVLSQLYQKKIAVEIKTEKQLMIVEDEEEKLPTKEISRKAKKAGECDF